jgi:hypothetical protein
MVLTREFFDTLVIIVIVVGLILAARRFYQDMTRPLPPDADEPPRADDDTQPHPSDE